MKRIDRGAGLTRSERRLAKWADKTFLDLWSYPNTYNDRNIASGQGQEFCDLLVVCGADIIIFSDKFAEWPKADPDVAWSRWYKRAVDASIKQIRGAEKWLREHPDRIFLDKKCVEPLPIDLPDADEPYNIHAIAVASGAEKAAREFHSDKDGSLFIAGSKDAAENSSSAPFPPFFVGDPDPTRNFVHVMDYHSLRLVMRELDTITDFVRYLNAREDLIRNKLWVASGEKEILAGYLQLRENTGQVLFPPPGSMGGSKFIFEPGKFDDYRRSASYRVRKDADRGSYGWDKLIGRFSKNLLEGTSVTVAGMKPRIELAEKALRQMAREDRVSRRALSYAFASAFEVSISESDERFARMVFPFEGCADPKCGYVFLILAHMGAWLSREDNETYRDARAAYLRGYCQAFLYTNRELDRVVAVAVDAPARKTGKRGSSEDVMMLEIKEWTRDLERETEELMENASIMRRETLRPLAARHASHQEMASRDVFAGNRKARRSAISKSRKKPRN